MKLVKNKYDGLLTVVLSLASVFVITEGNKWHEPFMYALAVTITMYSYVIAVGMTISISALAMWGVIHSFTVANKIRQENLQLVKSMIAVVDDYNNHKAERFAQTIK